MMISFHKDHLEEESPYEVFTALSSDTAFSICWIKPLLFAGFPLLRDIYHFNQGEALAALIGV